MLVALLFVRSFLFFAGSVAVSLFFVVAVVAVVAGSVAVVGQRSFFCLIDPQI